MVPILIDTHAFLWFVFDDPRLSAPAGRVLADPARDKVLSMASLWEIAVKVNIGKLDLGMSFSEFIDATVTSRELRLLELGLPHLSAYAELPLHHRDPFDRLLVAQAKVECLVVLTSDECFSAYGIETFW
ncbi:MAG: type II toxin-antitoxin system VapC family toxin [Thermoanaerobaculales bacterium]